MLVCREIQWDMGHRILSHQSVCKNLHGHRYRAEVCLTGSIIDNKSASSNGMVIDFGDIKKIAEQSVLNKLDHSFMYWKEDKILLDFFSNNAELKSVSVPFTPTVENIAKWIFEQLEPRFRERFGTDSHLYSIKIFETPSCFAIYKQGNDSG
ncbi:MAG: 6-carboxytetrahydropterin synthase [bacterium]|nr:6-carboxytetrahydropterin synthase [bacterium]